MLVGVDNFTRVVQTRKQEVVGGGLGLFEKAGRHQR